MQVLGRLGVGRSNTVEIGRWTVHPDHRRLGWLAAQLGWKDGKQGTKDQFGFRTEGDREIKVVLHETNGQPISRCMLRTGTVEYKVVHREKADLLDVAAGDRACRMPAGKFDVVPLLSEELMRGGPHKVYLRAMNCVRKLL